MKDAIFASVQISTPAEENEEVLAKRVCECCCGNWQLRNVQKKLREITQIKAKWSILNEDQVVKVNKEGDLQKEAEELQNKLNALKK